jgi:hypothetical protein
LAASGLDPTKGGIIERRSFAAICLLDSDKDLTAEFIDRVFPSFFALS